MIPTDPDPLADVPEVFEEDLVYEEVDPSDPAPLPVRDTLHAFLEVLPEDEEFVNHPAVVKRLSELLDEYDSVAQLTDGDVVMYRAAFMRARPTQAKCHFCKSLPAGEESPFCIWKRRKENILALIK
jgi:hypothetical protein